MNKTIKARLEKSAAELNIASDGLNLQYIRINDYLKKLNIGVQFWRDTDSPKIRIGYGRLGNKWGLLAEFKEGDNIEIWHICESPRFVRIAVAKSLAFFIEELSSYIEGGIEKLSESTNIVCQAANYLEEK